jgi:cation-transporting ATPase 13A2
LQENVDWCRIQQASISLPLPAVSKECVHVTQIVADQTSSLMRSGGGHNPDSEITWTSVDDEKHKLDSYSLKPIVQEYALGFDPGETEQPDYQLALTGDVFRWMLEFAPLETMQRVSPC